MLNQIMILAEDSAIFNMRNGILLLLLIVILVGYKLYKDKYQS